jgi:hypothetical protein
LHGFERRILFLVLAPDSAAAHAAQCVGAAALPARRRQAAALRPLRALANSAPLRLARTMDRQARG